MLIVRRFQVLLTQPGSLNNIDGVRSDEENCKLMKVVQHFESFYVGYKLFRSCSVPYVQGVQKQDNIWAVFGQGYTPEC